MKLKKSRSGMALISVLLLTVILSMLTVSMVFISTNHAGMMANAEKQMNALKAAEGMAEYALNQLNHTRSWGTGLSEEKVDFGKAKGYIYFTSASTEYLSYNNLAGTTPVTRSGNDKLAGQKVPAFTAEIICKGTCGNAVKYLKVIYLRSDIYPYPLISDGRIIFDEGNVKMYGDYSNTDDPGGGNIHSNWLSSDDSNSIIKSTTCAFDAKGGVVSAAGNIAGFDDVNSVTVRKNLGKQDGHLNIDDLDPNKIVSEHVSKKAVKPGTYLIAPLYYIPDKKNVMKEILENARAAKTDTTLDKDILSYSYSKVPTPATVESAVSMGGIDTSEWDSANNYSVNYNVSITDVEGVTHDAREGVIDSSKLGWDKIRVASITTTMNINVTGKKTEWVGGGWFTPPHKETKDTSGDGVYTKVVQVDEGLLEFKLSPNNGSYYEPHGWLINKDEGKTPLLESEPLGLAKLEESGDSVTTVKYLPIKEDGKDTAYSADELGLSTSSTLTDGADKKSVDVDLDFTLTDDIYISGTPGTDDYTYSLNKLAENPNDPTKPNVTDNIFRIMGFTYEDKIGGKTYKLNTKLDLNNKNIYSGSHVILGTKVSGEGSIISKGKVAYVYNGIESNKILSMSDDDLYIQTTAQGKYNVNGYLYSGDDVCIEDFDTTGALAGAIQSDETVTADDMLIKGTIIGKNKHTGSDDANQNNSITITGKRNKIFAQGSSGWEGLAELRGDAFSVRIGSWFELN